MMRFDQRKQALFEGGAFIWWQRAQGESGRTDSLEKHHCFCHRIRTRSCNIIEIYWFQRQFAPSGETAADVVRFCEREGTGCVR